MKNCSNNDVSAKNKSLMSFFSDSKEDQNTLKKILLVQLKNEVTWLP